MKFFFRIFFVKMTKEHQISNFLPFKPPFHPFRGWFRINPFLVDTYILIGTYTPNFMFIAPVVSALRWSSVSQFLLLYIYRWNWWIMVKWIVVMKIKSSICLDDWGKPRKNPSQVGRHRDSNQGPPECESRALPRSHSLCPACYCFH